MKGFERNFPCPCGSGKKWKNCHPQMQGHYFDENHQVIHDRKPIIAPIKGIGRLTPEEQEERHKRQEEAKQEIKELIDFQNKRDENTASL